MLENIKNYFANNHAVTKVAEDPALTAELLLLVRILFADGNKDSREVDAFVKIAQQQFGLSPKVLPDVIRYLTEFGYETTPIQAATLFAEMKPERRVSLVKNLMIVASADNKIKAGEAQFIQKISAVLGVNVDELEALANEVNSEKTAC